MNQEQMMKRCPGAKLLGVASLPNHRLAFTIYSPKRKCGCADVVPEKGGVVYGLLYELDQKCMEAMDRFEGHPIHYRRTTVTVTNEKGESIEAETYVVVNKVEELSPSAHYLGLIKDAADRYQFPEEYRQMLSKIEAA